MAAPTWLVIVFGVAVGPVGATSVVLVVLQPVMFDPGYAGSAAGDLHRVIGPLATSFALIACWEATRAVRWPDLVSPARW
ncbi:MAG: hypothetical protein M3179_07905 [Actinomycetota bacterium]|nr:hypothetical protein [Actinomycetota bacterium]